MYWKVLCQERAAENGLEQVDGRFTLQKHVDEMGVHLDLRLEQDGHLVGWRIEGNSLAGQPWAVKKAPHSIAWLDAAGPVREVDAGVYAWVESGPARGTVVLHGHQGMRELRLEHEADVPIAMVRSVWEAIRNAGARPEDAGALVSDGVTARHRAVERLCGLGRELDGTAFDEQAWRRILAGLDLESIQGQLRAFEVRFDHKYPPVPVSRPERLPEPSGECPASAERAECAMEIARE